MKLKAFIAVLSVLLLVDAGFATAGNKQSNSPALASQANKQDTITDSYGNQFSVTGILQYISPTGCPAIRQLIKHKKHPTNSKPLNQGSNAYAGLQAAKYQYSLFCAKPKPAPIIFGGIGK